LKKKNSRQSLKQKSVRNMEGITIGLDLGDTTSRYCAIDINGQILRQGGVATTRTAMREKFSGLEHCRIALEVGPHSPWVSRLLAESGTR
jgi:transposase